MARCDTGMILLSYSTRETRLHKNVNMHSNQTSPRYEMCGLERNECERRQRNKGGKKKGRRRTGPLSHEFLHIAQLINPPIYQQQYHNLAADAVKKRERVRERHFPLSVLEQRQVHSLGQFFLQRKFSPSSSSSSYPSLPS